MFEHGDLRRTERPPCPCEDRHHDRTCSTCAFRNLAGHKRPAHRGFVRVIDHAGSCYLCTLCAGIAVVQAAEWAAHDVTVLVDVPAGNIARWLEVLL